MLTPVEGRAERRLREFEDFARVREAAKLHFAEEQLIVEGHLEPTLAPGAQGNVDHDGCPGSQDLSRQADRLVQVVSRDAELDGDAVLRIQHGSAANISRNALGALRVIRWSYFWILARRIHCNVKRSSTTWKMAVLGWAFISRVLP